MGANDPEAADYYMKKLTRLTLVISILWNALVLLATPVMLLFYDLSPQAKSLVFWLVVIHNLFNAVAFPISGPFSNGLRAAGDVKFTMYISLFFHHCGAGGPVYFAGRVAESGRYRHCPGHGR